MLRFLQKRRIQKKSTLFWEYLEEGEIQQALEYYHNELAGYEDDVKKQVRAAYHFHHWLTYEDEGSARAVEVLASGEIKADTQVMRAAHLIRRLKRERQLGKALRQRDPEVLTAPHEKTDTQKEQELEQLGLTVLESYRLAKGTPKKNVASYIGKELPSRSSLSKKLLAVWKHLSLWSSWYRKDFASLLDSSSIFTILPEEDHQKFIEAAIYAWGNLALTNQEENLSSVILAVDKAREFARDDLFNLNLLAPMTLTWTWEGLYRGDSNKVIQWINHDYFQKIINESPLPDWLQTFLLALGLLKIGQYSRGQNQLKKLMTSAASMERKAEFGYLHGLSLLAETENWSSSHKDSEDTSDIQFDTMWRKLRDELMEAIVKLTSTQTNTAWRGSLLKGLIAYMDSETTPTLNELETFSAAIENVANTNTKRQLKSIEGELLTRVRATEEAIEYIQRRAYPELRSFQDKVLDPLGDAIPGLIRAAVYMTIWEGDPSYDPLPALKRIPLPDEDSKITQTITACMDQVKAAQVMQELTELLNHPKKLEEKQIPSLTPLNFEEDIARMGATASAVLWLTRREWKRALNELPSESEQNDSNEEALTHLLSYIRFYSGWKLGDLTLCEQNAPNPFLKSTLTWKKGLEGRHLLSALKQEKSSIVLENLSCSHWADLSTGVILRITEWLLKNDHPFEALNLYLMIENHSNSNSLEGNTALWLPFLQGLVAAKANQFTSAIDAFELFLSNTLTPQQDNQLIPPLRGLAQLFRLEAELAIVVNSKDNLATRWPSVRRSLANRAKKLQNTPTLYFYGYLITGLITYLTPDQLVDKITIDHMQKARQELQITYHPQFLEDVLGHLRWRREVLNDFWDRLNQDDLQKCRDIFRKEIKPVFGDQVPSAILLAMVIADWDSGEFTTEELLTRLKILEHDAANIDPNLILKVKDYIQEADQTRQFTKLVKQKEYDRIIQFIERSDWADAMPVPVAIAVLHTFYKKKRHKDAKKFGHIITDTPRLPNWVRDYGYLILGYLLYDNHEYVEAAEKFEKISASELLGKHNIDKYWAAGHFARGIQHLEGGKKEEAFDDFRRTLNYLEAKSENVGLSRLFTYFGLQSLETQKGRRAQEAFSLLRESVEGLNPTHDVVISQLVADIGLLLCEELLDDENTTQPVGKDYLQLSDQASHHSELLSEKEIFMLKHSLHQLAICQELRHEGHVTASKRKTKQELRYFLSDQTKTLEEILKDHGGYDPVLLVIKGLIHTRLKKRRNITKAIEHFSQAARLGLSTPKFNKLVQEITKERQDQLEKRTVIIDLFDTYLLTRSFPKEVKKHIQEKDPIADLYQSNRGYTPQEVTRSYDQDLIKITDERISHLEKLVEDSPLAEEEQIKTMLKSLRENLEQLKNTNSNIIRQEKLILTAVTSKIDKKAVESKN
jgi:hypothetical protein